MIRIALCLGVFALASFVPPAETIFESALQAQQSTAHQPGPTERRMQRLFARRVNAEKQHCNLDRLKTLRADMKATEQIITQQMHLIGADTHNPDPEIRIPTRRRYGDMGWGVRLLLDYDRALEFACDPKRLANKIRSLKRACDNAGATRLLAKLRGIVGQYSAKVDAVRAVGSRSKVPLAEVEADLRNARNELQRAANYEPPRCEEPAGGDEIASETITLAGMSEPAPEAESEIDPQFEELGLANEASAWLLGDWVYNAWNGGLTNAVLRFRLEADGTISANLVSVTDEMARKGYQPGMQILRGIRDTSDQLREGATWTHSAMTGETFSPRDPNREPGQVYGQDEWTNSGVIFIERATGYLGGSTGFQNNRLNFHRGKLSRPDQRALDEAIARLSDEVYQLTQPGNEAEMLDQLPRIIGELRDNGQYSQEAREAAAIMQLLLERDELLHDPELRRILGAFEAGEATEDDLRGLAGFIVEQSAHLAQPITNNDYSTEVAARMFQIVRSGSQILDDLANPSGAYARTNASRLTRGLTIINGISGLARNPSDNTGQQLMNGVRDLTSTYAARAGVAPALDIPAQTSAAILQQSAAGFEQASQALREVGNAIGGDPGALNRALGHARRLQQTISSEGYLGAVSNAVTDRVVRRVPFVRSVVDWFK